jgi:hypothetical protein
MADASAYFAANPDVEAAYKQETYGLSPEQFATAHYNLYGAAEQRAAPEPTPVAAAPSTTSGSYLDQVINSLNSGAAKVVTSKALSGYTTYDGESGLTYFVPFAGPDEGGAAPRVISPSEATQGTYNPATERFETTLTVPVQPFVDLGNKTVAGMKEWPVQALGNGEYKLSAMNGSESGWNNVTIKPDSSGAASVTASNPTSFDSYNGGNFFSNFAGAAGDLLSSDAAKLIALGVGVGNMGLGAGELGANAAAGTGGTTGSTLLDYSMPTSTGGLGLQGTAALDGTLASGLAAPAGGSLGGGLGLTAGTAGNIAAMGGAQGLLANAAGGGTLSAGGVNTGLFTADNLAKVISGGGVAAANLTNTLSNLTPVQASQLAKAGINVAGLLAGGAAVKGITGGLTGTGGGGGMLTQQDRSGVSSGSAQYSPEYYQAIQAKYNQMMPQQPRDVTTDLKSWYETKYAPTAVPALTAPVAQKVI